jgi:hypothetical protein
MKRFFLVLALAPLLVYGSASAEPDNTRILVEELMALMKVEENLIQTRLQIRVMMTDMVNNMDIDEAMKPTLAQQQGKILDMAMEGFTWPKMKDKFIDIYVDVFTYDEVAALLEFYQSPAGQSFVAKMPQLTQRILEMSQEEALALIPRIQEMTEKSIEDLAKD